MTPYLILTIYLALVAITAATAQAGDPSKGAVVSTAIVATWTCQTQLGQPRTKARSPWTTHSSAYWAAELNRWTNRLNACKATLKERKRQWNWQAWLPAHWYRVGSCETGYGGPPNWRHSNSTYQGAFGFHHQSWDGYKLPGYPDEAYQATPWQQYQVALEIYKRFGMSGWGCKG